MRTLLSLLSLLVMVLALVACGAADDDVQLPEQPAPDLDAGEDDITVDEPDPTGPDGTEPELAAVVDAAVAELADELGIDPADVEVVVAEPVTWSDGSLGCPEPGMMYTQAVVDGYRVLLRAGDVEVAFHAGEGRVPLRCEEPREP